MPQRPAGPRPLTRSAQGMDWISDTTGEQYTATQGSCHGLVWQESTGGWKAIVSHQGVAVRTNRFTTLEEAWAWCEAEIAPLAAAGRCPE